VILEAGEAPKPPASHAASVVNDLTGLTAVWMEAVERLAELNNRAMHTTLAEQQAIALQAAEERSLLGAWRLQSSYSLAGTAKAAAYLRHVGDILLGAYADAVNEAETSFNRGFMAMTGMVDNASRRASSAVLDLGPDLTARPDRSARIVDDKGEVVSSRRE
jgi:phasin family protein